MPVICITMPGAIVPAAREAAFTTEAAVNVGVCAAAGIGAKAIEIASAISDVRNGNSIFSDLCVEILV